MEETACILVHVHGQHDQRELAKEFAASAAEILRNHLENKNQGWVVSNAMDTTLFHGACQAMSKSRYYLISMTGADSTEEAKTFLSCQDLLKELKAETMAKHGVAKADNFDVQLALCIPKPIDTAKNLGVVKVSQYVNI